MDPAVIARFEAKVVRDPDDNGCHRWTAARDAGGYDRFGIGRRAHLAHRISYEIHHGAMPEGLVLDHLCRNPWCVNPDHLEAVTIAENCARGNRNTRGLGVRHDEMRAKTHCPQGHEYTTENTYRTQRGWRVCATCAKARARKNHALKREGV